MITRPHTPGVMHRIIDDRELGSAFFIARLESIDVLRFIAASFVVAQHVLENSFSSGIRYLTEFSPGVLGVVLFFLVSGYAMPLSIRRGFVPTDFALRRVVRIYPALLTAFTLWAISGLFIPGVAIHIRAATAWDWIANILLIQELVKVPAFVGVTGR